MIVTKTILFMLFFSICLSRKPDKVYCGNQECSVPISKAKTLITYNSGDPDLISYKGNAEALVFMKSAGTHPELWFAVINGKAGFVNSQFLREQKIFEKNPSYTITLPLNDEAPVRPERVHKPHEVVEGTTLYTTEPTTYDSHHTSDSSMDDVQNDNIDIPILTLEEEEEQIENNISIDESSMEFTAQNNATNSNELSAEHNFSHESVIHDKATSDSPSNSNVLPVAENVNRLDNDEHKGNDKVSYNDIDPLNDVARKEEEDKEQSSTQVVQVVDENHSENSQKATQQSLPTYSEDIPANPYNNDLSQIDDSAQITDQPLLPYSDVPFGSNNKPEESRTVVPIEPNDEKPPLSQNENIFTSSGSISMQEAPLSENIDFVKMNIDRQNNDNFEKNDSSAEQTNNGVNKETVAVTSPNTIVNQFNNGDSFNVDETVVNVVSDIDSNKEIKSQYNNGVTESFQHSDNTLDENNQHVNVNQKIDEIPAVPVPNKKIINIYENVDNHSSNDQVSSSLTKESPIETVNDNVGTVSNTSEDLHTVNAEASLDTLTPPETPRSPETPASPQYLASLENLATLEIAAFPETLVTSKTPIESETPVESEAPIESEISVASMTPTSPETPASPEIPASTETTASPETLAPPEMTASSEIPASSEMTASPETPVSPESLTSLENPSPETYPNEPLKQTSFFADLYSTVSDFWTTTSIPPIIKELSTTPDLDNTNFDKDSNISPKAQHESVNDEKSFSIYDSMLSAYHMIFENNEKAKHLFASNGNNCLINDVCEDGSKEKSNRLTVFMLTTSISVLLFSLGYYYIDKKRQDGRLVGMINSLQRDLLCSTKECEILKEELTSTKTKLTGIEDNSFGMDDMVQSLKGEIEELKAQNERLRNSLDDNEKLLRVSENTAGELQNTLGEVENTLRELLTERAHFEEQILELNGKIQAFEEELIAVSRERDSFQLKYVSAESALEEAYKQKQNLDEIKTKLQEAENTIQLQKHEIAALKECIKDLKKGGSSTTDVASIIDHTELKAKLAKAIEEKSALEEKYSIEYRERTRLQEELHTTQQSLHMTSQQATEAVTRLEVLEKYFQERESELMKELNAKEALWLSKQGESASTIEKIEVLQQEVQRYKEKCDSLTLELAELESSKRTAIAELEARAHAAWLEARTARRDAAADREAAATLRRKLASITTQPEGAPSPQQRIASPLDNSGPESLGMGVGVIPPPLPPIAFLPPLLPPLPRPPPLGRLPSPHPPRYNDGRYSPESRYSPDTARYSPDSRYSPEPARARGRGRYSPDSRYSPRRYSPPSSRRSHDRYEGRGSRQRNGPVPDTETEYASDSPGRSPPPRRRYSHPSGPSSGSGCSSDSEK